MDLRFVVACVVAVAARRRGPRGAIRRGACRRGRGGVVEPERRARLDAGVLVVAACSARPAGTGPPVTPHLPLWAPLPACEPPAALVPTPAAAKPAQRPTAPQRPQEAPAE
jgi:hypothetical protein